jgi:putative two-component system response regulator
METKTPHKILIVDDEEKNRKLLGIMLQNYGYAFRCAANGAEALAMVKEYAPDLIFLDIMMPGMDGYAVCQQLKADQETSEIPVVMVTALADQESRLKGLEAGASDFLTKPVDKNELMLRAKNLLQVKAFSDFLKQHNDLLESEVLARTAQLLQSREQLKESYHDTVIRLTIAAEFKDEDTASHISRVGIYCCLLARELGWTEEEQEVITYAAPMHDIGKIGIPSDILLKRGKLNNEEFALMKTHATIGGKILAGSTSHYIQMGEQIALTHHERWDGKGYPCGLNGEEIPLSGRIMNIADQYDALRSARPYKLAFDHDMTCKILIEGDGRTMPGHFDPRVHEAFRDMHREFAEIYEKSTGAH